MELNQFRDVDVVLDKANDNIIQKQFVSAGDKEGRSLTVQLTDNGVIGEIIGATLNLYWHNQASGLTDLSAFYVVDRATSVFKIDYPQNMLTPGKVIAYIQILHGGKVTHTKPFEITVQNLAGTTRGVLATAEYGALVTKLAKANEFETEIAVLGNGKVDKNGNEQVTMSMLDQGVKESMTGGSVAVVGSGSVNTSNILKSAVTESKTTFFEIGKNLFDMSSSEIILKSGFSGSTGNIVINDTTDLSAWIEVLSSQKILLSIDGSPVPNPAFYKIAFYKNKNEWLSTHNYVLSGITVPPDAYLMRVQYKNSEKVFLQIELDSITPYEAYKSPVLKKDKIAIASISPLQTVFFMQGNLFDADSPEIILNKGFSGTTGTIVDSSLHNISHLIDVPSGDKILLSANGVEVPANGYYKVALYKDDAWVATIMYATGGVPVVGGATKIRVQYDNRVINFQVEFDTVTPYQKFKTNPFINPIFLPDNAQNLTGKNFTSYGDSLTFRNMWQPYIISKTGMIHTNLGVGSTTVALVESVDNEYPSLCNETRLQAVKNSNPIILTINGGTNDKHRNVPIGENAEYDKPLTEKDKTCYKGALSYIIEELLNWKKDLIIILITPPQADKARWNYDYEPYAAAMMDVANYYGLSVADWYHKMGVNKINVNDFTIDGLHQNDKGGKRAANIIVNQLEKISFL